MGIARNLTIYFILIFILGISLLFLTIQNITIAQEEVVIKIALPDKINICTSDEKL